MSRQNLRKDINGNVIQAFVPDPNKSMAPQTSPIALSTVINLDKAVAICLRSDADITRYFNGNATFTRTIPANTDTIIVLDEDVTEINLVGAATVEIEVM